jgi:hypothetical protein
MSKVYDWFEERLEVQANDISSKYVPPHVNIFLLFCGLVLTCFNTGCDGLCNDFLIDQVLLMHALLNTL